LVDVPFAAFGGIDVDTGGVSDVVEVVDEAASWRADTDEPTSGGRLPSRNRANAAVTNAMAMRLARQCSAMAARPSATARASLRPARRGGGKMSPA
jgi:hypothetical protein